MLIDAQYMIILYIFSTYVCISGTVLVHVHVFAALVPSLVVWFR